jgi:hypothetical protein
MDGRALCAGLLGAALGAAACYRVTKRDWWTLNGVLSIGAALMLGVVTEGSSSREEHEIVTVIMLGLLANFFVAASVRERHNRRRPPHRQSGQGTTDVDAHA